MGKLTFGATTGISYQVDKVSIGNTGAPKCPRCNDRVYFNEERRAVGKAWHIKCFNCVKCKKKLDSTTMASHEDEIYCRHCHKKEFGPKGYGFAGGAAGLAAEFKPTTSSVQKQEEPTTNGTGAAVNGHDSSAPSAPNTALAPKYVPNPNDINSCPRCGKKVYFAEEVKALGRKYHRLCFKCSNCNKMLEPGRCSTHENDLYCNNCYGRKFGPKGYGFAGGAGTMLAPDVEKMTAGVPRQNSTSETEVAKKKQDPISRQQKELVESRPKDLASGTVYGASNSIFDSRKDQRSSGGSSPNEMQRRVSPMPQDHQNVVLVPHDRTRFSPNITQEEVVRKSPQNEQSWTAEEFRRSPMPQEPTRSPVPQEPTRSPVLQEPTRSPVPQEPIRSQTNVSPAFQDNVGVNQISPNPQEQRTSPADRSVSPRYGSNLHPNGAYYSPNGGSVEELSRYNDNSLRAPAGQQGGPSPIDHLVSNMYTRSVNQNTGYAYATGETGGPAYHGEIQRQRSYHSTEDLSDSRYAYQEPHVGASHAKSASIDGSIAYGNVGSDAAIAAALAAARAKYGHVSEVPEYVNPTVPAGQPQYNTNNNSTGPSIRQYTPEPQYVKTEYGPPSNYSQTSYGQQSDSYNPQYQPRPENNAPPSNYSQAGYGQQNDSFYSPQYQPRPENTVPYNYDNDYRSSHQPPSYNQLGSEAYSHSNAHGYRGRDNGPAFSGAVDDIFSRTMPTVRQ